MWQKALAYPTAFIMGLIMGFFLVIAPLFAGGPWREYLLSLVLVLILFLVAGICFGAAVPRSWTSITLSIPTVILVVILWILDNPDSGKYVFLFMSYPAIVILSSISGERIGSLLGIKWRSK